jgi:hypothetical protein
MAVVHRGQQIRPQEVTGKQVVQEERGRAWRSD